ncbi:MAG: TatD family hydrolase [Planctomycetes bacterium]|nr:TatD family hydrolase [Planctomycetota bacterium]
MIDSHTHLYWERFDGDRSAVIDRARAAGVEAMIVIGVDPRSNASALELARSSPDLHASVGFHPNDLEDLDDAAWSRLDQDLADEQVVAIGETGLDYYWKKPVAPQFEALHRHFALAEKHDLPLVIHTRDSIDDLLGEIERWGRPLRGVLHCFSGNPDQARRGLELGFDLSFAGPLTYKKAEDLRQACAEAPIERLHVETDCPFLPPQSRRGQRNEPAFLPEVLAKLAELHHLDLAEADRLTSANSRRLFAL